MKRKLLAVFGILALLLGRLPGSVLVAAPASAQVVVPVADPEPTVEVVVVADGAGVQSGHNIFLPIVSALGQSGPPPVSPYAAALSQALVDCAGTALNQVCYGRGSVTLHGGGPLTTPGQVADLDGVSGLTLVSPDAGHWSVALLRLAADSPMPGLGLTLLAFGNVEIRNLTLFDAVANNGDVAPALSFRSSPVPGEDPETGALILYNPAHEEPLSISLNGADLTLASSAVVQAQPGVKMTVTMATGTALVSTAAGDGAVIQTYQLSVPLDGNGSAAGAPTLPDLTDDELLEPLVPSHEGDPLASVVPPRPPVPNPLDYEEFLLAKFDSAYHRCMQGDSRQVYRVLYYARLLDLYGAVPDDVLILVDAQVSQCATFEIEFNSVITGTSAVAWGSMAIQGQGMMVSYGMDGSLDHPASMPLTHLRYDFDVPVQCPYQMVLIDGTLSHFDGYMRINRNRLAISTTIVPLGVHERIIFYCPGGPPYEVDAWAEWFEMFYYLHESEFIVTGFRFTPDHWKYRGNEILAEAIFSGREAMFFDGISTGNTWLVMLHRPGH